MSRPLIAYFSPLKPTRSGIADYSERLLPELARYFDIHLYVDTPPSTSWIREQFKWYTRRDYELQVRKTPYDLNIYQIGNSEKHQFIYPVMARYPGAVVLHDANVHHSRAFSHLGHKNLKDYLEELEWCHGEEGKKIGLALAHGYQSPLLYDRFPMLRIVCENARSVIVHNEFSMERVKGYLESERIHQIALPYFDEVLPDKAKARNKLGIRENETLITSFGFMTPSKGIANILEAFTHYQNLYPNSRCVLIGGCLDDSFQAWLEKKADSISNVHLIGYADDACYRSWLSASDICISLRYPTQGESSDALLRIMGAQKPVIIPDYRQFREIPSDACVHLPLHPNEPYALFMALKLLTDCPATTIDIAKKAREFVINTSSGPEWIKSFVEAIEHTLALKQTEALGKICPLRHVRVSPVEETVALSLSNWGDISLSDELIKPVADAMEELGLDD